MEILSGIWDWLFIDQPAWVSNVSNLTSFTILGTLIGFIISFYHRYNCDYANCPRLAFHKVDSTTYRTCEKHLTVKYHTALQKRHAKEKPEQHALLGRSK